MSILQISRTIFHIIHLTSFSFWWLYYSTGQMLEDTICCQDISFKIHQGKEQWKRSVRWAHESFQSYTLPQYINHTVVQIPALSTLLCTSVRQVTIKVISYSFGSATFACLVPCPAWFLSSLAWNAIYEIQRYGSLVH